MLQTHSSSDCGKKSFFMVFSMLLFSPQWPFLFIIKIAVVILYDIVSVPCLHMVMHKMILKGVYINF